MVISLALVLLLSSSLPPEQIDYETAHLERRLRAVKISEKIAIDGNFDEPAWSLAPPATNFVQREPEEGADATEQTTVRVLYDDEMLYIAIYAKDSQHGHVIISELKKDFNTDTGDSITIALDTFHDGRNAYEFGTNPAGAKWDAQMVNEGKEVNANWDGVWYVKSHVVEDGWTAEVGIPFKTLKFPNTGMQTWGINFERLLRRRNEQSSWSPLPRIFGIDRVSLAGTLEGIEGVEPGANIKIKPYSVSSMAQSATRQDKVFTGDVGLDVKYGITPGLTWDFTYNTDFSQVEADEQQINLSRFSLFFPEKREFFLENSGIFNFGGNDRGSPMRLSSTTNDMVLFFSRTIGLSSDGQSVPILGGSRLTGRAGGFELGMLNIQQRPYGAVNATNFSVGRIRKNILENSDIGFMVVNKEVDNSTHYNRVSGGDANFRFGQSSYLNGHIAKSFSPLAKGRDLAGRIAWLYQDNIWNFRAGYTAVQEHFIDEMGFAPRLGMRKVVAYASRTFRPKALRGWLRQSFPHWQLEYVLDRNGNLETKYVDWHLPFTFQNGGNIEIGANPAREYLSKPLRISGKTVPAGVYVYNEYFFMGRSDASRILSGNVRWGTGTFYTGYKHSYQVSGTFRPNYTFNTGFTYTHNNISLGGPDQHVKTNLLTARFALNFSTAVFLNGLIQYNSDAKQWSSNIRFNVIHHPLSDFFFVYNERRNSLSGDLVDRALIAKLTYMIAR